jgi:selenocysteine lyase/cysteine desulfurase
VKQLSAVPDWHDEFPIKPGLAYLNHAAVGVWPRRTAEAVKAFADENMAQGASDYPRWMEVERQLRMQLVRLINAESIDDIALLKNTSEGLSLIAFGLDWREGDNIVSSAQEFPSNRMVWEALRERGVELRLVDVESGDDPEDALERCMDGRTRLLSISSVQFASGFRLDMERIGQACQRHDVLFCVDAIQSLGALGFDVQLCHADFVVADGHKWLLGPEGLALFYSTPAARDRLQLLQYGWHMVEHPGDFDSKQWQPAQSARRFEPGSPNQVGIQALHASLSLFEEVGMQRVESLILDRTLKLRQWIQEDDRLHLTSSSDPARYSGIVSFRLRDLDAAGHATLYRDLMANGVICALRAGSIRLSPHFYTSEEGISYLKDTLFRI